MSDSEINAIKLRLDRIEKWVDNQMSFWESLVTELSELKKK